MSVTGYTLKQLGIRRTPSMASIDSVYSASPTLVETESSRPASIQAPSEVFVRQQDTSVEPSTPPHKKLITRIKQTFLGVSDESPPIEIRILAPEDNLINQSLLKRKFKALETKAIKAGQNIKIIVDMPTSFRAARKMIIQLAQRGKKYDEILTDNNMAEANEGFRLFEWLRQNPVVKPVSQTNRMITTDPKENLQHERQQRGFFTSDDLTIYDKTATEAVPRTVANALANKTETSNNIIPLSPYKEPRNSNSVVDISSQTSSPAATLNRRPPTSRSSTLDTKEGRKSADFSRGSIPEF